MSRRKSAPIAATRRFRSALLAALVFIGAAVVTGQLAGPSTGATDTASVPGDMPRRDRRASPGDRVQDRRRPASPPGTLTRTSSRGEAGGAVGLGVTPFDDTKPAVANLDRALLAALRRASLDAARHGLEIVVSSGWRSPDYQERLLRRAIAQHGSAEEAARWVATAETSAHVTGHAVDIGPSRAMAWLSKHGAAYGLCQIYRNEPWHYELRREAIDGRCPAMYADPRDDPRMQQ